MFEQGHKVKRLIVRGDIFEKHLMFEATDVEDNFRVSNPVPGNGGGVRLASVVVGRHVLGGKQPTLDFSTNQGMIFNSDLCVVLEGGEKITPLCNPRNLRDAPFKPGPEKITHICFTAGVLGF